MPDRAVAETVLGRATEAVGGFFRRVVDLLGPSGGSDDDLDRALQTYAKGNYFTTWVHANRVATNDRDWLRDESDLLAGLAAAAAGIREEAVTRLRAVLDAEAVSPYYPVALAALLELDQRLENPKIAAENAARYLGDFWRAPRNGREAAIKGVFLETGDFTVPRTSDQARSASGDREIKRRPDRPTDRAVYLAGMALLRAHEFDKAAHCFESLTPNSAYYAYARYGLGQASYGLHDYARAEEVLADVYSNPGDRTGELYLRDRAALLSGQILHEIDEDSAAINWLRQVSTDGPFGLHAALLAAEIQADREQPALALVYLKERPQEAVEPKLVAHAAALDARLHRDLQDTDQAIRLLEEGIRTLDGYEGKLRDATQGDARITRLLLPLETRQKIRDRVERWRRENVSNAVPDLLQVDSEPGLGSRWLASALADADSEDGHPVIYYRRPYDPFTALPLPGEPRFEPPSDSVFPSLFRRSQGNALSEALRYQNELADARDHGDGVHLSLMLLDGELRLRATAQERDDDALVGRLHDLGFGDEVLGMVIGNRSRSSILLQALSVADPQAAQSHVSALREEAAGQITRWESFQRQLVREAVRAEAKSVQDLRYLLEFELSQALATKKEENRVLQGAAPTSGVPGPPRG